MEWNDNFGDINHVERLADTTTIHIVRGVWYGRLGSINLILIVVRAFQQVSLHGSWSLYSVLDLADDGVNAHCDRRPLIFLGTPILSPKTKIEKKHQQS